MIGRRKGGISSVTMPDVWRGVEGMTRCVLAGSRDREIRQNVRPVLRAERESLVQGGSRVGFIRESRSIGCEGVSGVRRRQEGFRVCL